MAEKDILIEPRRGRNEKPLPARALMVVNPFEADYALKTFQAFAGEAKTYNQTRLVVDNTHALCLAGPALGAPAAALVLEKLIVLGVREVWLISCCGSVDPSLTIGDMVLGNAAVSGEGVSGYYHADTMVEPDLCVTAEIEDFARKQHMEVHRGTIWSTDAPYRERRSGLLRLQERYGIVGVDMEFSALCSVAAFRGVALGALFVVSDMLWTHNWKPGFNTSGFRDANRNVIEKLVHCFLRKEPRQR